MLDACRWPAAACKGGQVIGASDEIGALPEGPAGARGGGRGDDLQALGIDLEDELPGPQGRPMPMVDRGVEPIQELF